MACTKVVSSHPAGATWEVLEGTVSDRLIDRKDQNIKDF